jgi:hypothetical protein
MKRFTHICLGTAKRAAKGLFAANFGRNSSAC